MIRRVGAVGGLAFLFGGIMFHCVENTLDITYGETTVRVWLNVPSKEIPKLWSDLGNGPWTEIKRKMATDPCLDDLILWVSQLPNVNAVQVMQKYSGMTGDVTFGVVAYTVPFDDVHG